MKRPVLFGLVLIMTVIISGCGESPAAPMPAEPVPAPEVSAPATVTPEKETQEAEPVVDEPASSEEAISTEPSIEETEPESVPEPEPVPAPEPEPAPQAEAVIEENLPSKEYKSVKKFKIEGTWINIGEGTFGQMQKNAAIAFNGTNCNVYSPFDTYAFYQDGDNYVLNCTSPLGETIIFNVGIIDKNHIDIIKGPTVVELERVK